MSDFSYLQNLNLIPHDFKKSVVAIGNFDGMHRGHQQLFHIAQSHACNLRQGGKNSRRSWGVVTFEPHPRSFFQPQHPVFRLTPPLMKGRLAEALGADFILSLPFTPEFALLTPEAFIASVLVTALQVSHVVTGYDFHFGQGRKGTPDTLKSTGQQFGFGVTKVEQVADDDRHAPFSSSAIRTALQRGDVQQAARDLGYYWMVTGRVGKGDQRGRELGFPTANLTLESGVNPLPGIYAVRVYNETTHSSYQGVAYFGSRPTFKSTDVFLEIYLFDFSGDLYGHLLSVAFIDFIRADQTFTSPADLITQMTADCVKARQLITHAPLDDFLRPLPLGNLQLTHQLPQLPARPRTPSLPHIPST